MAQDITAPNPGVILDLLEGFRCSKIMFAAVSLGVFDALGAGPKPLGALASELLCDTDALERLLDACVCLRLLTRDGSGYHNTPAANAYLSSGSPERMTGYIRYSDRVLWKLWDHLDDAVREGTHRWNQAFGWEGPIFTNLFHSEDAKQEFLLGMHGYGLVSSPLVVSAFDLSRFTRLVDLGGATGHLAVAACRRYPALKATVFDLSDAVPLAKQMIGATEVAGRISVQAGDFFADQLPVADLFAVGRILHDWSQAKIHKLLGRIFDRLPPGGGLLIAEKLLLEDKTGPRWAHLQSLNMLTCTEGKERTLSEYEALLAPIGFVEVVGHRTSAPLDAVLARKPG